MTTPRTPPPLVRAEPLADGRRRWVGWYWSSNPLDPNPLDPWRTETAVPHLADAIPCLWADQTESGAITRVPAHFPAQAAPTAQVVGPWYLAPPPGVPTQAGRKAQALQLLQLVTVDADTHALEDVFRQDPALTYQLLKLVNAAGTHSGRTVSSLSQAILLLGRQTLQRWLQLMVFSARDDDPRCALLLPHVVLRARGMELLCLTLGGDRRAQEEAFVTGMLSLLDVLFGQPTTEVLAPLALAPHLQLALTEGLGDLGGLLALWKSMEEADFAGLTDRLATCALDTTAFNHLLLQACHWVGQTLPTPTSGGAHA
jgi:HDOD domain